VKVCLVNPPFLFPRQREAAISHCLGLRSISSYLKERGGHEVTLVDLLLEGFERVVPDRSGVLVGLPIEAVADMIPSDCAMIGVSAPFSQLAPIVHDLVAQLRRAFPQALVVMGGMYPSTQPHLALQSEAHAIVVGEGEVPVLAMADGADPRSIRGVYTSDNPPGQRPAGADVVSDLDCLPSPDYEFAGVERYFQASPRRWTGKCASVVTSRGCPFDCEFCSIHPVSGHVFRGRSADMVLEEVELLAERFGVRRIEFEDDNFAFDRHRVVGILEGLVRMRERGTPIEWRAPNGLRIDSLDDELIRLMKRSGCVEATLALEHGDPEMLRLMNKRLDLGYAFEVFRSCHRHAIPDIALFYLVGYPGETKKNFARGLRYLRKVRRLGKEVRIVPCLAQPYPGTRLLARCLSEGYLSDPEYGNFLTGREQMETIHTVSIEGPDMSHTEVLRRKNEIMGVCESPIKSYLRHWGGAWLLDHVRRITAASRAEGRAESSRN